MNNKKEYFDLINHVEKNLYCSNDDADWCWEEKVNFDHVGEMPIYILDVRVSEMNANNRYNIIFIAIQPSGRILKFTKQYDYYDEQGRYRLSSKRHFSMTISRYARIVVKKCRQRNGDEVLRAVNFDFIPDEEILKIIDEMEEINGVEDGYDIWDSNTCA